MKKITILITFVVFLLSGCGDKSKVEDLAEKEFSQGFNHDFPDKHIEIYEKYGQIIALITYFDYNSQSSQFAAYYYQKYNGEFILVRKRFGDISFLDSEGL